MRGLHQDTFPHIARYVLHTIGSIHWVPPLMISPARDRKDYRAALIRQAHINAHAPSYGTTHAPRVSDTAILIKKQKQVPLLVHWDRRGSAQF